MGTTIPISKSNGFKDDLSMWLLLDPHERDAVVAREALDGDEQEGGGGGGANYKALVEIFVGRKSSHVLLIKQAYQKKFRRRLDQDIINMEPPHPFQRILVALASSHKAHHADISQHIAKCDAKRLYETGEGKSSGPIEEATLLEIFSKRTIPQLKLTFSSYKHIYGHDYSKSLLNEKCGEFEDALKMVVKCMCNPSKYYAKLLYASMKKGMTKDRWTMARVLVSRAEIDMDEIQSVFKKKYGMELRDAIFQSTSSGDYRDFLVSLATKTTSTHITTFM